MLRAVTAPTAEPLTEADVRKHLRQQVDDANALINFETPDDSSVVVGLITAAREACEQFLGWPLTDAEYVQALDAFDTAMELPAWATLVTKIEYLDADDALATLDPAEYWLDTYVPTVYLINSAPTISTRASAVRLYFKGPATDVPQSIKQAMLLLIGHWYMNREATTDGRAAELPLGVESLLRPWSTELSIA